MHVRRVLLFTLVSVFSLSTVASHIRHEQRDPRHGAQWIKRGKAPAETEILVEIAIRQRNLDYGHSVLMDISDPASPKFGQHMTPKEVAELFSPAPESITSVRDWLVEAGIDIARHKISASKTWYKFNATVQEVEELIQAEYHIFGHKNTDQEQVACDEYSVPRAIHPHIDFITPTVRMTSVLQKSRARDFVLNSVDSSRAGSVLSRKTQSEARDVDTDTCYAAVTPLCIQRTYYYPGADDVLLTEYRGVWHPKWLNRTAR